MGGKVQADDGGVTGRGVAFVAGATGYTGHALVAELARRGIRTVAHVRPDSPRLDAWRARFDALGADVDASPWTVADTTAALERHRPTAVFALLGTTRARGRAADVRNAGAPETYEAVDYGLSVLLLRATVAAAPAARFVYLSSMGVGPGARGAYLRARWRVEQELRASGLDWTIVRPAFISGPDRPERRPVERGGALLADGLLAVAAALGARRLRDRYSTLSADELARGLARAAFAPHASRRVLLPDELRG